MAISVVGEYLQSKTQFFGLTGAAKNMLYFSLGYFGYDYMNTFDTTRSRLIISWGEVILAYVVARLLPSIVSQGAIITYALKVPIAVWGCINAVLTCKEIAQNKHITDCLPYRSLKLRSYRLYLFSDPFNYILIYLLAYLWGENLFTNNIISATAFSIRIIGSTILAYALIIILNALQSCVKRFLHYKQVA